MVASLLIALAAAAAPASAPPEVAVAGATLTTARGAPLYVYANDTMVGMSHCSDACAIDHPPLIAPAGATGSGPWSLVDRGDGARQWAFHDKPLYTAKASAAEMAKAASEGGYWTPALADAPATAGVAPPRDSRLQGPSSPAAATASSWPSSPAGQEPPPSWMRATDPTP